MQDLPDQGELVPRSTIVYILKRSGGSMRVDELARRLDIAGSSVKSLLKGLENKGILTVQNEYVQLN